MPRVGRITQHEIARLAGVSQATVSLVLNDAKAAEGRIPEETRRRVHKVIRDTGYVADPIARRMAKGRNRILGVFTYEPAFPSSQSDFFAPFLLGIEETAQRLGYDLLLLTGAAASGGRRQIFDDNTRLRLADGCVILGREFDRAELRRLVGGDYPFVAVGRREAAGGPVPYVGGDYVAATATLVAMARDHGHTRFAYIGRATGPESIVDRWHGFASAMTAPLTCCLHRDEESGDASETLAEIAAAGASVAFFTELADAIAVVEAARAQNLTVPGDLSMVVLGSHIRPTQTGPAFTTFAIPREEMARRATAMLIEQIEQDAAGAQVLLDCPGVAGETLGTITTNSGAA